LCGVFKRKKTLFKCKKFAGPKTLRQIFEQVVQILKCQISLEIDESKTIKRFRCKSSLSPQLSAMVEWLEGKKISIC
jgi:hypothetical protein